MTEKYNSDRSQNDPLEIAKREGQIFGKGLSGKYHRNKFTTYFAYALVGYLFVHFALNIGMNMGLVPVVGIPLPFISKGGSFLMIFSIMFGVVLKMDSERNVR